MTDRNQRMLILEREGGLDMQAKREAKPSTSGFARVRAPMAIGGSEPSASDLEQREGGPGGGPGGPPTIV